MQGKEEVLKGGASILNNMEALCVLAVYKEMLTNIAELRDHKASVAVISPYKAQVSSVMKALDAPCYNCLCSKRNTHIGALGRPWSVCLCQVCTSNSSLHQ